MQRIEQLDGFEYFDYRDLRIRKKGKTQAIYGNMTAHVSVDNSAAVQTKVFIKQGGEYRLMPYKIPSKGICDWHNEDKLFYPELASVSRI